jgi:hypothetical protein
MNNSVISACFADYKLRFNSRIDPTTNPIDYALWCVIGIFYLANFSRRLTKVPIAAMLSETLRMYKLIRKRAALIHILKSLAKNITLIRRSLLWTLNHFRSSF